MEPAFRTLTDLGVSPTYAGKVREMLDLGDHLLIVTTDRISAFDCILPDPIPGKGKLLNGIATHWFRLLAPHMPTHFVSDAEADFPSDLTRLLQSLRDRWMLVRRAERISVECVVRGYLAGSSIDEYRRTGSVAGHRLPPGIQAYARLPEPIFTPTTKEDVGHDQPLTVAELADRVGTELAGRLEAASLRIFQMGEAYALSRGLILVDTKFEFGWIDGDLHLIDEALTPDSSRYWDALLPEEGTPTSLDKEYLRSYLKTLDWDRNPPAPALPPDRIEEIYRRYRLVYDRIRSDGPPLSG